MSIKEQSEKADFPLMAQTFREYVSKVYSDKFYIGP